MSKTAETRAARRNPPPPGAHRIAEAAALTQTSASTIYKWIRASKIIGVPHNGILYVHLEDVQKARRTRKRAVVNLIPPPEGMVTTRHAANVTGAGQISIQEWARAGKIRAERYGKKKWLWYVDLKDVQRMARESKPGVQK
jgi:predicted site-specific integrase-resolvase